MIDELQPEALYSISVVAYTVKGDGVHSKALLIKTPAALPSAPRLTVRVFNETYAEVFWTPQHSSNPLLEILGFRLTYAFKNHSHSESIYLRPEEREYVVSGLNPGAVYSFLLAARGRSGYGEEAREDLAVPEIPDAGFPVLSEHVSATCCSLQFSWIPPTPSDHGSAVTRYTLMYGETVSHGLTHKLIQLHRSRAERRPCARCENVCSRQRRVRPVQLAGAVQNRSL